jgi:ethanolaminephosphotransferase
VYFITYLKGGASYWQQPMLPTLGVPKNGLIPNPLYQMAWNEWLMFLGGMVLVFNTITSALNVIKARRDRGQDPYRPLLGLLPIAVTWTLIPAYLSLNPVILHHHLVPFILFAGLVNAYSVGQMIVAHLVKARFPYQNVLVVPLALAVVDSLGPRLGLWPSALGSDIYQVAFVFLCLGLSLGVYGSFVHDVITTICDYLDIWCLTIKHPYVEGKQDGQVKKSN